MGQALSVYLLPEAFRHLPGSGDQGLLADVLRIQGDALRDFDEQAEDQFGDDGLPLTMTEAITGLFTGQLDPDYPFYGIAFEFVCSALGESLDNRGFVPCSV